MTTLGVLIVLIAPISSGKEARLTMRYDISSTFPDNKLLKGSSLETSKEMFKKIYQASKKAWEALAGLEKMLDEIKDLIGKIKALFQESEKVKKQYDDLFSKGEKLKTEADSKIEELNKITNQLALQQSMLFSWSLEAQAKEFDCPSPILSSLQDQLAISFSEYQAANSQTMTTAYSQVEDWMDIAANYGAFSISLLVVAGNLAELYLLKGKYSKQIDKAKSILKSQGKLSDKLKSTYELLKEVVAEMFSDCLDPKKSMVDCLSFGLFEFMDIKDKAEKSMAILQSENLNLKSGLKKLNELLSKGYLGLKDALTIYKEMMASRAFANSKVYEKSLAEAQEHWLKCKVLIDKINSLDKPCFPGMECCEGVCEFPWYKVEESYEDCDGVDFNCYVTQNPPDAKNEDTIQKHYGEDGSVESCEGLKHIITVTPQCSSIGCE